ncbi:hypothetical protein [Aminipila luticellarii]|uniref:hypothetical protein n=1 Tax=Aminipila luticellarii TaxID=2507160 RepID=UPI00196A77FB|nr:hypothetical protein [Aminipila luticellarii]
MENYYIKTNDGLFYVMNEFKVPLDFIRTNSMGEGHNSVYIGQFIRVRPLQEIPNQLPEVPNQLGVMKTNTEDMIDNIYASNWQDAMSNMTIIKANMNGLVPLLQQATVPAGLINNMNVAVNNLNQYVAQNNRNQSLAYANQITMYIADVLDYFNADLPTDINRLEYLGRQIILNVENMNWSGASANYSEIEKIWERLRPSINEEYASDIEELEGIMTRLGEAISSRIYQTAIDNTNLFFDQLDVLKTDLSQQNISQTPQTPTQTPQTPSQTPQTPTQTPQTPTQTPQTPSQTPQTPSQTPQTPTQTPQTPTQTPQTPSQTPQTPTQTPQTPTQTPQTPTQTPQTPTQTPQTPTQTPQTPTQTPQTPSQTPQTPSQTPQTPAQAPTQTPQMPRASKAPLNFNLW